MAVHIDWRHLANTIERSACGGDATLWQITLIACYQLTACGVGSWSSRQIVTDRQREASMSAKAAEAARVIGVLHVAAARSQQCRRCRRCCRLCCCCCWWWWWWCSRELFSRCVNWPHAPPPPLPPLVKNSTTARVRSQCRISDHKISGAQSRCYQRWSVRGPGARLTWLTRWLVCR